VNVGLLEVPPCRITSAVPSQLLPTNSTGVTWLGAAAAGDADASATLAAQAHAAIKIVNVFLAGALTLRGCFCPDGRAF
jgi:hypothetical protein